MPHYVDDQGVVRGWGPTAQEISSLACLFDTVRHIACLHDSSPPATSLPYTSSNIKFIPVPPSGGPRLLDKFSILRHSWVYLRAILNELPQAHVVHVRCPANISLMAVVLLALLSGPRFRWAKYAGNWSPQRGDYEPGSYRFQRWWLSKGLHRGVVTVNGKWPKQPRHVYSFLNPSLTAEEIAQAKLLSSQKVLDLPLYLLFVGAVNDSKGAGRVLQIAKLLHLGGVPFELHVLGDGEQRPEYEAWSVASGIGSKVFFHGWLPKHELACFYARAHFLVFPSSSEGWAKVLSEAMTYGVVPIASAVSSIPQILTETGAGVALPVHDTAAYVNAITHFVNRPELWQEASRAGSEAASAFTYEYYLAAVQRMFQDAWGIALARRVPTMQFPGQDGEGHHIE